MYTGIHVDCFVCVNGHSGGVASGDDDDGGDRHTKQNGHYDSGHYCTANQYGNGHIPTAG